MRPASLSANIRLYGYLGTHAGSRAAPRLAAPNEQVR